MKLAQERLACGCTFNRRYIFLCAAHDAIFIQEAEAAMKTAWHDREDVALPINVFEWMDQQP